MTRINALLERRKEDAGFTLIELMVVVLIIGILIAIAIPTFLGARTRAQDRSAQSDLRNTVTNAKAIFTDQEDYTLATATELQKAEPSLTYVDNATVSDATNKISTKAESTKIFVAAAFSASKTCWYIRQSDDTADVLVKGLSWGKKENAGVNCTANYADTNDTSAWSKTPGSATAI